MATYFKPLSAIAASLMIMAVQPAMAQSERTWTVKTADLNLASPSGQAALQKRIMGAVNKVCAVRSAHHLNERRNAAKCKETALFSAQKDAQQRIAAYKMEQRLASANRLVVVGN